MNPSLFTVALGWAGTVLVIASYAQANVRRLRMVSLVASAVLVVFNVVLGIWPNVALELALVTINLVRLARRPAQVPDLTPGDRSPGALIELPTSV